MTESNLGTDSVAAIMIVRGEVVTSEVVATEGETVETSISNLTCVEMKGEQVVHPLSSNSSSKAETTSSITAEKTVSQSRS